MLPVAGIVNKYILYNTWLDHSPFFPFVASWSARRIIHNSFNHFYHGNPGVGAWYSINICDIED